MVIQRSIPVFASGKHMRKREQLLYALREPFLSELDLISILSLCSI